MRRVEEGSTRRIVVLPGSLASHWDYFTFTPAHAALTAANSGLVAP